MRPLHVFIPLAIGALLAAPALAGQKGAGRSGKGAAKSHAAGGHSGSHGGSDHVAALPIPAPTLDEAPPSSTDDPPVTDPVDAVPAPQPLTPSERDPALGTAAGTGGETTKGTHTAPGAKGHQKRAHRASHGAHHAHATR